MNDKARADDPLEGRIRRLVSEQLGVDNDRLTPEVSLTDELAADSLDLVELALALENEFDITIGEISELNTYGDAVRVTRAAIERARRASRGRSWGVSRSLGDSREDHASDSDKADHPG